MTNWFEKKLAAVNPPPVKDAGLIYIHHDQLNDEMGPISREKPASRNILLVESHSFWDRRPYHRQKIALVIANQRAFAIELARRGWHVEYCITEKHLAEVLGDRGGEDPIGMMTPAEWETRSELSPLVDEGLVKFFPHDGWLTTSEDFQAGAGNAPWRMDAFYRHVRQKTGYLMENGKPVGGRYSFDGENRKPWKGDPSPPVPPRFSMTELRREVGELIRKRFSRHPGELDPGALPVTIEDAVEAWSWAKRGCMEHFGPFEDAMSVQSSGLFHTRISGLLNIHRILPEKLIEDVLGMDIPLNSKEGFLRQVIGWREFVRHVHEATNGFRQSTDGSATETASDPGDGGYTLWAGKKWTTGVIPDGVDGGAMGGHLAMENPLPPAWWGRKSGLHCLDTVVEDVWKEGWSHHITRLMVLSNIATLLDVSPRELTDWFWVAYTDAWDWVVEPNVLGMGTFALGELMTTKPYVAGAAYINRMSDYCGECAFKPNGDCPIRRLYWAFLDRHEEELRGNPRMFQPMNSLNKRSVKEREEDRRTYQEVLETLLEGRNLHGDFFDQK